MNRINLKINKNLKLPKDLKTLIKNIALNVLRFFNFKSSILDIYITDDEEIKHLNKNYRKKDKPTDVLSFNINEYVGGVYYLGEIVISYERVVYQAKEFGVSVEEELTRLLVHGIVHLMGYDHELSQKDEKIFFEKQDEALEHVYKSH